MFDIDFVIGASHAEATFVAMVVVRSEVLVSQLWRCLLQGQRKLFSCFAVGVLVVGSQVIRAAVGLMTSSW